MKRIFLRMLTVLGGISLLFFIIFFIVNLVIFFRKPEIPDFTVLELDLDEEIIEYRPDETMATALFDDSSRLIHLLEAIEKAGDDKRVSALVAKVGNQGLGLAVIQEIRDAIITFRQKGKKAIAYADTLGEFGQANGAYYLASAFDEILIQPSGSIGLTGLIAQTPFIKGTLDMVGVKPRMDARAEYKNAMNTFTEDHYTEPHQEAMETLLDSWFEQMVRDIASNRGLKEVQVIDLFDRGLFTAQEAKEAGLIDGLYYPDEVLALVEKQTGAEAKRLAWQQYLERAESSYTEGKTIALIYGVGAVKRGKSGFSPVSGNYAMGSETLARAFRQAVDDEKVSAIIFRIDSPGGSYVASDTIWRETVRAKEKGIPVIVSMGNMAGSGGYFVSMAADKIVAQPATITGSIGVFAGKMLTSELWEKLGITWDEVYTSKNATFWTGTHDYTPEQWALFQSWMDHIYEDFTSKVAQGRKMPTEKVLEIAKGRIWSGEDALRLGLVDQLGGYRQSIALAKKSAKIDEYEKIQLKEFPRKKSMLTLLKESMLSINQQRTSLIQFSDALKMARPYLNKLDELGYGENPGVLSMTPWIE
ncbi:MAG: signal peptide peptidase SppA [Desulfobacterales bacterium]